MPTRDNRFTSKTRSRNSTKRDNGKMNRYRSRKSPQIDDMYNDEQYT